MNNQLNHLMLSSKAISGTPVRTSANQKIGKVKDIVVRVDLGCAAFVIMKGEGPASKDLAIPLQALCPDTETDTFVLNITKEQFAAAPSIDPRDNDHLKDEKFLQEVLKFYNLDAC